MTYLKKTTMGVLALAMASAGPALSGGHISAGAASGGPSVSISTGAGGALSMSVSNGQSAISINSGALGPGSGAELAEPAIRGLDPLSVEALIGGGGDNRVPNPCSLTQNAQVCD